MSSEEPPLRQRLPESNLGRNMGCLLLLILALGSLVVFLLQGFGAAGWTR